jgi:holo-[acyl-carrier protein] synthase
MIITGVDLIEIARIERAAARHGARFYNRFFTAQEQAHCAGRAASLAGRFAVKEAVAKALGTGIGDVKWTDVEVVCDGRGRPELHLHENARDLAAAQGIHHWSISLSHSQSHAIGFVVAFKEIIDGSLQS